MKQPQTRRSVIANNHIAISYVYTNRIWQQQQLISEVESNYSSLMKMATSLNCECTLKKECKWIENEMESGQNN